MNKPLSAEEIKSRMSGHMGSVWDAAALCLADPSEEHLAEFKELCRPAELILLMRDYAESSHP